jgi:hypothetical protein
MLEAAEYAVAGLPGPGGISPEDVSDAEPVLIGDRRADLSACAALASWLFVHSDAINQMLGVDDDDGIYVISAAELMGALEQPLGDVLRLAEIAPSKTFIDEAVALLPPVGPLPTWRRVADVPAMWPEVPLLAAISAGASAPHSGRVICGPVEIA